MSLADTLLKDYEKDFVVNFLGKPYPVYFLIEHLLWIVDKNNVEVHFLLNEAQCLMYRTFCEQKRKGVPIRVNDLKSRQMGGSAFIAAFFFILTLFQKNINTCIIADTKDHAGGIFDRFRYFYDHLDDSNPALDKIYDWKKSHTKYESCPYSFKPKLRYAKGKTLMMTEYGNSSIEVIATGESAGRSRNYTYVHCSEVAFWQDIKATFTALLQTVSATNLNSIVVIETTANGFNDYKNLWDEHFDGTTNWKCLFLPWFLDAQYKEPLKWGKPKLEEWEIAKQKEYNLSDEQMAWYHSRYLENGRDKDLMAQEYPFSVADAFVSTGNSVFDKDLLYKRKNELVKKEPLKRGIFTYEISSSENFEELEIKNIAFKEESYGLFRIYEEPIKGHPYVVTVDPNDGGNDDSAIQVIDNFSLKQVACFNSSKFASDEILFLSLATAIYYNNALLAIERNRNSSILDFAVKFNYDNMYLDQDATIDSLRERTHNRYGYTIKQNNRSRAIDLLKMAFRDDYAFINDYETICEMESFQRIEHFDRETGQVNRVKQEAVGGSHDDLVMALCGFFIARNQQTTLLESEMNNKFDFLNKKKSDNRSFEERELGIVW